MSNSDNSSTESDWFLRRLHQTEFRTIAIPREGPVQFMRDNPVSCIHLNSADYRHVSRTHCTVEYQHGQLVLTDVSSSTGTYVNDRMLSRKSPGSVSLEEGDVIGIGCPTMGEDSYYQIHTHALLFRVCRKRQRDPTVKTEGNVIVISDDESLDESSKEMPPSSAAPTTLEQKVDKCEPPDEPSLPPLLQANDQTGSRSPIKAELPYQSDSEINDIQLPPLQRRPDALMPENSEDSTVIVLDDDEYTDQHYSQMVLENIKTESVDVPDEAQDPNDCPDVLRTSGEWFSKLNNTHGWPFGRSDRQAILCDPKPMRKRRCSVVDNDTESSGTTAAVSRQAFPSEIPSKPVPKRRLSVVEAEKIVKKKMKRRASVSERCVLDVSKKKEHHKQIAKKLQEVAAKESAQKAQEAQRIGAQQKTGVTLPRVKSTPNRGDFLMDPIATCSKKAPAKNTMSRPSYEDGILCTQSTTLEELPRLDEVVENRSESWIPGVRYPKKLTFQSVEQLKTGNFKIPKLTRTNAPKTLAKDASLIANSCTKSASVKTSRPIQTSIAPATVGGKRGLKSALSDVTNRTARVKKNVSFNETLNVTHTVGRWIGIQSLRLPQVAFKYRSTRTSSEAKELGCILRWEPDWLEASDAPTSLPATCVSQLQDKYSDFSELCRVMHPLLQLELRHDIFQHYKKSSRVWYVRVTMCEVMDGENSLKVVHCEVHNRGRNDMPLLSAGVIGVLDYPTLDGQRNRCFGYIRRNIKPCFNGSNNNSAGTSFLRYMCQIMLSDQLVMEKHYDDSITFLPITTISPYIREANGLCMMEYSRILPIILDPEQNREQVVVPENAFEKHSKVRKETVARITPNALNEGQMDVMLSVLEECCLVESPSVSLIQGPPGTGKSRVISQLALELWRFRRPAMKVMICAQSNTAVDVIGAKLINLRNDLAEGHRFNLVRVGTGDKIDPSCRSIFLDQIAYQKMQDKRFLPNDGPIKLDEVMRRLSSLKLDAWRECESTKRKIMEAADIVCTTLGSCHTVATSCDTVFQVCIIDEATQCTEPSSFMPLQYDMTKLVLVGDINQLPATVLSNRSKQAGFCDSLFSRMYKWFHRANLTAGIKTLNVQYRMHPEICSWPNNHFYENRLICHPTTAAGGGKLPLLPYLVLSLAYDQVLTQAQHQVYNRDELLFVVKLLKQVLQYCRKDTTVAIITPYQRQKSELVHELKRNQLQQIAVHSIDSVQGKEFDIVFVSLARSIGTGFLNSGERINVALTRARHSLILCGNFGSLMRTPVWSALLKDAAERKVLHELEGACADTDVNSIMKKLRIRPNL